MGATCHSGSAEYSGGPGRKRRQDQGSQDGQPVTQGKAKTHQDHSKARKRVPERDRQGDQDPRLDGGFELLDVSRGMGAQGTLLRPEALVSTYSTASFRSR